MSISFDQLHETAEYAAYARGGEKTPEGLSWLYNFIKAQGERNYGKIYVRFPEAVSMREYLGEPHGPMATDEAAKRLAHAEDGVRGGLADPAGHAGQRDGAGVGAAADHPRCRADARPAAPHPAGLAGLPGAQADSDDQQRAAAAHGRRRPRRRWTRCPTAIRSPASTVAGSRSGASRREDEHEAAFYRNTIIDAFLETSIVELALAYAARADGDRLEAFWAQAMRLRDLLKFDFYFADSAAFREHVAEEMSWHRRTGRPTSRPAVTRSTSCCAPRGR